MSAADKIVERLWADIVERWGVGEDWSKIPEETQEAIRATWREIVEQEIPQHVGMANAYRVEINDDGCAHCNAGQTRSVIGPDGVAVASLAEEQDAIDLARELNRAYSAGQAIAFQQLDRRSGPAERRKDSMSEKAKGGRRVIAGGRRAFDDEIPF